MTYIFQIYMEEGIIKFRNAVLMGMLLGFQESLSGLVEAT
jgi:hypothetical protein